MAQISYNPYASKGPLVSSNNNPFASKMPLVPSNNNPFASKMPLVPSNTSNTITIPSFNNFAKRVGIHDFQTSTLNKMNDYDDTEEKLKEINDKHEAVYGANTDSTKPRQIEIPSPNKKNTGFKFDEQRVTPNSERDRVENLKKGDIFNLYLHADQRSQYIGRYKYKGDNEYAKEFICLRDCDGGVGEGRILELSENELSSRYSIEKMPKKAIGGKRSRKIRGKRSRKIRGKFSNKKRKSSVKKSKR